MKLQLAAAATLATFFLAGPASAQVVQTVGDGPERMCYLSAKTAIDLPRGLDTCNSALNTPLIQHDRGATFVNRGVIEHKMGRTSAAMADFNECLRMIPDQPDAYINRGITQMTMGSLDAALADVEKGISLGPSEPALAYFDRGIVYEKIAISFPEGAQRQANLQKALADYQRAAKEAPEFTAASNALARFRTIPKARAS